MSAADDFKAIMIADTTLMDTLTGGVYTPDDVGPDGITRDTKPAFDEDGFLMPCALVRERSNVPVRSVSDDELQLQAVDVVVEIYNYEDGQYGEINTAQARQFTLFQGKSVGGSLPVTLINVTPHIRDDGPLGGASLQRQDWLVPLLLGV